MGVGWVVALLMGVDWEAVAMEEGQDEVVMMMRAG